MRATGTDSRLRSAWRVAGILLGVATAIAILAPAVSTAQCPGCGEYVYEPPEEPADEPEAPPPVAPAAPTYVPPPITPTTVVPVPVEPEPEPDPEKPGSMVKNRSEEGIVPIALSPIDPASAVSAGNGSILPLVLVLAAATAIGVGVGLRRRAES